MMYDEKEYQELLADSRLDDKTNAVLGVWSAQVAAMCGGSAFTIIIALLVYQGFYPEVAASFIATLIVVTAVCFSVIGFLWVCAQKHFAFNGIKENIKLGYNYL